MILPAAFHLSLSAMAQAIEGDSDTLDVRLGTFAFWAVALDERLAKVNGDAYSTPRDIDPAGRLLLPLRFARNALAHGSIVMARPAGFTVPFALPLVIPPDTWRPLSELVREWPDRRHPGGPAEVAYGDLLSGRPVGNLMPLLRDWFVRQAF
ncbi:hypothetical protein [Cryocola sp. 340MFSha3.1]|uniref:hypothetical protein n=1 Tax=Cryocola sp. 340MFSha3.1 TaxID=1169145 RepID=UPI0005855550|nr:hypothetical protein [Cryocola sp. 340MFSha3.1]